MLRCRLPNRGDAYVPFAKHRPWSKLTDLTNHEGRSVQFSRFHKPMFRVAFEDGEDDGFRLLDFLKWLHVEKIHQQIVAHPLGPADVWLGWSSETFVGFSSDRIMLQSGHHFGPAERVPRLSILDRWRERFAEKRQLQKFKKHYSFDVPAVHQKLQQAHPGAYLRCAESFSYCQFEPKRMLEIGAGNCVHVAYRHLLNPNMQTVVIDLPESMCAGFLLLRTIGVDVALPNENREAAVRMRLPIQDIDGLFDFAFNMSSFQEMKLDTVNRYIALIREHLTSGGTLQLVNLQQSRQMPENKPEQYDYTGFATPKISATPYHSFLSLISPVLCVVARVN